MSNYQSPWVPVVLCNYYRRQRPLDLLHNLLGCVSPFWCGVLRTANAFRLGLLVNCWQGALVKFWKDCWIGDVPLAYAFPSLFEMASDKDAWGQFTNSG